MELSEAKKALEEEIWRCTKFKDSRKRIAIEIVLKALDNSISKDKIRNLDVIDISGFECVALEDIQELLGEEGKYETN